MVENIHSLMTSAYILGIKEAYKSNAVIAFFTPDFIAADGSFVNGAKLIESGKKVIYIMGIRTIKEKIETSLQPYMNLKRNVLSIKSRDLVRLMMRSLHPISTSSIVNGCRREAFFCPSHIYWQIDKEGILGRGFHLHPLFVDPERKSLKILSTVDYDYVKAVCPTVKNHYIVQDSDEILLIEMSSFNKIMHSNIPKPVDFKSVSFLRWVFSFVVPIHCENLKKPIFIHTKGFTGEKWENALQESKKITEEILKSVKNKNFFFFIFKIKTFYLERFLIFLKNQYTKFKKLIRPSTKV